MDYMHQTTDKQLKELEKRLKVHYRKANFEMQRKLSEYLKTFDAQDRKMFEQVKSGKITKDRYKKWRSDKVLLAESWKDIRDQIAKDYTNANKQAAEIIAKDIPNVVAENRDYSTYDIEQKIGYDTSFTLTDRETVNRLIQERPNLLPSVYASKDTAWNRKLITSAVTQGILQGESMVKIAKRLTKVTEMNRNSAIRNARTAVTGAENAGRQSGFERALDLGIKLEKQWIATKDGRTRHSHRQVDGEIVPVNETFSNGCEYPADPLGLPEETYNCRCTMISVVEGHEINPLENLDESKMGGMSYEEWKDAKAPKTKDTIVNGKDISKTWKRRPDKFDFEIEDVINAQGFDGLPKVVSSKEFKELQGKSDVIGFRGYSAPNKETLTAYQKQLYNGKWYVDCTVGTSVYGQGMYVQGVIGDVKDDEQMIGFSKMLAEGYGSPKRFYESSDAISRVESVALDSSAKGTYLFEHAPVQGVRENLNSPIREEFLAQNKYNDIGSFIASKGYDYYCVYGTYDKTQEIVVLNRTKVIFKKG